MYLSLYNVGINSTILGVFNLLCSVHFIIPVIIIRVLYKIIQSCDLTIGSCSRHWGYELLRDWGIKKQNKNEITELNYGSKGDLKRRVQRELQRTLPADERAGSRVAGEHCNSTWLSSCNPGKADCLPHVVGNSPVWGFPSCNVWTSATKAWWKPEPEMNWHSPTCRGGYEIIK